MNYMLITSEVLSRLSDLFILRALIVMIVWTCSYRDVRSYYEPDVVVRWFLGEYKSKSEIHRRAKKFRGEVKTLFKEYAKELEGKMSRLADYLPSSALYGKVGKLWIVDSFLTEVPFGKRNKETLKKKFELELRQRKYRGRLTRSSFTLSEKRGGGSRESLQRRGTGVTSALRSSTSCSQQ
jgi:hypothetical protein